MSKDTHVDFAITLHKGKLNELESKSFEHGCNGLEKQFKLTTTNTTTNMHLFDADDKLKKYNKVSEIIDDYMVKRLDMYQTRKNYLTQWLTQELVLLSNKARYIKETLDGSIDLRRKKKEVISQMLMDKGFVIMNDDEDFKYLVRMPMDSVTEENVTKLEKEKCEKESELEKVMSTSIQQMWTLELNSLEIEYLKYREGREKIMNENTGTD